jgi:thiol-disulfide isomerase/thioredoxin
MRNYKRNERGRFRAHTAAAAHVPAKPNVGDLDVRSMNDAKKLNSLLENGNITLILIYADWCGHCHRYLPTWSELEKTPGRKANMARVHHDMQENVPAIAEAKIQGYPSVVKVLPSGELEEYKTPESEESTNALPSMRDTDEMKKELFAAPAAPAVPAAPASNKKWAFAPQHAMPRMGQRRVVSNTRKNKAVAKPVQPASAPPAFAAPADEQLPGMQNGVIYQGGARRSTRRSSQRGGMAGLANAFMGAIKAAGPAALLLLAHGALSNRKKEMKTLGGFKGPKKQTRRASTRKALLRRRQTRRS